MCNPVIAVAMVAMAAAAAYSSYSQQKAQSEQNKFARDEANRNADIAKQQAGILDQAAQREEQYAAEQARIIRERGTRLNSSNRAQLANSGIDFSGSSYDVFNQNVNAIELDAAKAIDQGNVNAYNKRVQASSALNEEIGFQNRSAFYNSNTGISYATIGIAAGSAAASTYMGMGGFQSKTSSAPSFDGGVGGNSIAQNSSSSGVYKQNVDSINFANA